MYRKCKKRYFYAGDLELSNCIKIFDLNIAIYIKENINNSYRYKFLLYFTKNDYIFNTDLLILLYYPNKKHYDQLHYSYNKQIILNNNNNLMKELTQNIRDITEQKEANILNTIKYMLKNILKLKIILKK